MNHVETAIIGAGPYGVSIAAYLEHYQRPYTLFGRPMESWGDFMPKGMLLKSEGFASNLWEPSKSKTLEAFCREQDRPYRATSQPVPIEQFLEYAAWFQNRCGISANGQKIIRLERDTKRGFKLTTSEGAQSTAEHVIIASGHMSFMYLPEQLRSLPGGRLRHTSQLNDLSTYCGKNVTVIGAGQAALETAALLAESGAVVRLVTRREINWNPPSTPTRTLRQRIRAPQSGLAPGWRSLFYSELPTLFRRLPFSYRHKVLTTKWGPAGTAWLIDRLKNKVSVLSGFKIHHAEAFDGRVRLTLNGPCGREIIDTDYVIAGTGFKTQLERLTYISHELLAQIDLEERVPKLDATFQTSVPNLFIVGILSAQTFGPAMRFMFGAKHTAPVISRKILKNSAQSFKSKHPTGYVPEVTC